MQSQNSQAEFPAKISTRRVVFFPEGDGYELVKGIAVTHYSKTAVVRSRIDGKLYVRKEALPKPENSSKHIQNLDVAPVRLLQDRGVQGIVELVGWVEYRNLESKCVSQLLKIHLDSIAAGVLNTDGHPFNVFMELVTFNSYPRIILGDWGLHALRPKQEDSRDTLEKWFISARQQIHVHIIEEIRWLILHAAPRNKGLGTPRRCIEDLLTKKLPDIKTLRVLVDFVNLVDDADPSAFATGDMWLAQLRTIYGQMTTHKQNPTWDDPNATAHRRLIPTSLSNLPYEQALQAMSSWSSVDEEGNKPACFWLTADLDQNNEVVDVSRSPPEFQGSIYEDVTDWDLAPSAWRHAHERTAEFVKLWVPDFDNADHYNDADYQGELYGGSVY